MYNYGTGGSYPPRPINPGYGGGNYANPGHAPQPGNYYNQNYRMPLGPSQSMRSAYSIPNQPIGYHPPPYSNPTMIQSSQLTMQEEELLREALRLIQELKSFPNDVET